ncbi:MAG: MBL fold metallo-hydrolase [Burkholderiales bacterium]
MANELEHQLDYPWGDELPALGSTLELAPGVRWLRMKLPFALDHINLWLLRDQIDGQEGWSIVDCGINNAATRAAWEQVFASQLEGLPVLRVVVTHMHPDHIGLAHWLTERWSRPDWPCRLWISATDWNVGRHAAQEASGQWGQNLVSFYALHGLTDRAVQSAVRDRSGSYSSMVPELPHAFQRLLDGLHVTIGGHRWTCHVGYGHAPEHMSLHCPALGVLISGDMVLPRISTNIGVHHIEPEADPVSQYLDSLDRMRALPADTLVLPSHGKPFRGLHTRIDQLHAHHADRLAEVLAYCEREPRTSMEVLPVMFNRKLDLHEITFALGETIAHVNALWQQGLLRRQTGEDGVHRFVTVPAAA